MRRSHSNLHDIVDNLRFGSEKYFQTYIEKKGDLNLSDGYGRTLLMWSVLDGKCNRVKNLIDAGCMLDLGDKKEDTALLHAVQSSNLEIAGILLSYGAQVNHCNEANNAALMISVEQNNLELVQLLLLHGADSNHACGHRYLHNVRTALTWAIENDLKDITDVILSAGQTNVSLHLNVCLQNLKTFQFLLAQGANAFYNNVEGSCGERLLMEFLSGNSYPVKVLDRVFKENGFCTSVLKRNDIVNCLFLLQNQSTKTDASDKRMQALLQYLLNLGMVPEVNTISKLCERKKEFRPTCICVPSLQKLTRTAIREAMCFGISRKVNTLPLPAKMKNFLVLKDESFQCSLMDCKENSMI